MRQLVTSADLTSYFSSTSRDGQALLPLLVRRLIVGTSSVGTLRQLIMPSGDDVRLKGLDGRVLLDAVHPYIPSGSSVWEMGIGANPKQKADSDFNKRTADPAGVDQACTTFVFVTPHVWAGKDAWAAEKRSEGRWKSVAAIDGQMLSEWMDLAPAVAAWFCAARRCPVRHIDDSDAMWRRLIESRVDLRVTPAVVIGNRDTEADQLRRWLAAPKGELHLLAESNEEAMAFVAAVVKSDDAAPSDANASSRVLFAHDAGALPYLGSVHTQHVVVAANSRVAADLRAHPSPMVSLVLPSPRQPSTSSFLAKGVIVLPPLKREPLRKSLVATGLLDRRADQIARESRGSLEAVLLSLETPIATDAPWLQPDVAHSLTSLVLAGSWAVAKGPDHEAVSRLADLSWVDIERFARSWLSTKSPLQIWGDYWDWKAWRSSWRRLAPHFTKDLIERFCEVACTVLGTRAPALDLTPDQRWLAAIYNKTQPHSSMLRSGLVNSIAMFSAAAEHVGCVDGRQIAARLVRQLLEEGSLADSWRSLASWLPDLAEAAPDAFLRAVDKVLDDPTARQWLYEEAGSFGPSGCHIHVWWALERLAWQPEHTARAVIALGRFVSTEREGNTSNRPSSSLTQIFMPWHPNTFANLSQRLAAFEQLCAVCPDAGWRCAMSILPRDSQTSMSSDPPQFHEWEARTYRKPTHREHVEAVEHACDKVLSMVGTDFARWMHLVAHLPTIMQHLPDKATIIATRLHALDISQWTPPNRLEMWEHLRETIARHEAYPDSHWAVVGEQLAMLHKLLGHFAPTDERDESRWLFEQWPDRGLPVRTSHTEDQEQLELERSTAVKAVLAQHGLEGVLQWAESVECPEALGFSLGSFPLTDSQVGEVVDAAFCPLGTVPPSTALAKLGSAFARKRESKSGAEWRNATLARIRARAGLEPSVRFALSMAPTLQLWMHLADDEPLATMYWSRAPWYFFRTCAECEHAIPRLLAVHRHSTAIQVLGVLCQTLKRSAGDGDTRRLHVLCVLGMSEFPDETRDSEFSNAADYVPDVLDFIDTHAADPTEVSSLLIRLEWFWIHALRQSSRGLRSLSHALASSPAFFVDVLCLAYDRQSKDTASIDSSDDAAPSEHARQSAQNARWLFDSWYTVPGLDVANAKVPTHFDLIAINASPSDPVVIGTVSNPALSQWIADARRSATEAGRVDACDHELGRLFAYAPADEDGTWPCQPVRGVIEAVRSSRLDDSLMLEIRNRRGVHSYGHDGAAERKLRDAYNGLASRLGGRSPRVEAILRNVAVYYDAEAKDQDNEGHRFQFTR